MQQPVTRIHWCVLCCGLSLVLARVAYTKQLQGTGPIATYLLTLPNYDLADKVVCKKMMSSE